MVAGAVAVTVACVLPVFLVGALAVQVSAELQLSPASIGAAVAAYFAVTALASVPVGRLVERHGPRRSAQAGVLLSAAGLVGIAVGARSFRSLLVLLVGAAAANALAQLAANGALARSVPLRRQGLTFGLKQSGVPLATLLAGAAVPAIGLTVGWRWAFGLAAALALTTLPLLPADPPVDVAAPRSRPGRPPPTLVLLGVATALSSASANWAATFIVASTAARGIDPGLAGLTLTLGSALCIGLRVTLGWLADRRPDGRHLLRVAVLVTGGGLGMVLMALPSTAALVVGAALTVGVGWSWPGLQNYAVVRLHPQTPAAATSITQTGVYTGGAVGPLLLGWLAASHGYAAAWLTGAGLAVLAATLIVFAARRR